MKALDIAGREMSHLRTRLASCDERRYHLHRTLQSVNFVLHDSDLDAVGKIDAIADLLCDQGYYIDPELIEGEGTCNIHTVPSAPWNSAPLAS
jgi:hypothetical protein